MGVGAAMHPKQIGFVRRLPLRVTPLLSVRTVGKNKGFRLNAGWLLLIGLFSIGINLAQVVN